MREYPPAFCHVMYPDVDKPVVWTKICFGVTVEMQVCWLCTQPTASLCSHRLVVPRLALPKPAQVMFKCSYHTSN